MNGDEPRPRPSAVIRGLFACHCSADEGPSQSFFETDLTRSAGGLEWRAAACTCASTLARSAWNNKNNSSNSKRSDGEQRVRVQKHAKGIKEQIPSGHTHTHTHTHAHTVPNYSGRVQTTHSSTVCSGANSAATSAGRRQRGSLGVSRPSWPMAPLRFQPLPLMHYQSWMRDRKYLLPGGCLRYCSKKSPRPRK